MKNRTLGRSGISVSAIGLGCMGMSEFYGASNEQQSLAVIHEALALGVNFFDSADAYGPFTNEVLLGKALKGRRDEAVIATKFGNRRGDQGEFLGICGTPAFVKSACDASLKRLGVDYIDVYYQHRVDPTVAIEETVGAMAELVKAGKVRALGMSEAAPATLRRAAAVHPIAALQTEYSLWSREPEDELLATCRELGVAFVAYSPLGRGMLSGQIRSLDDLEANDFRRSTPRFQGENFQKNLDVVDEVNKLAAARGCAAAQLALAWVLAQGDDIVPIPGTRSIERLRDNAAAVALSLSAADLAAIEAVAPKGFALGTRYDAGRMKALGL
ncbi:MAG: aldo/keto reductase [Gammaproteobacteria bacterium]|nr:aldo/keto reductase [Gammaproteobacteria bacterium]